MLFKFFTNCMKFGIKSCLEIFVFMTLYILSVFMTLYIVSHTLFGPFPLSDLRENLRIYWHRILERPGNMTSIIRTRSRSQGSTKWSKLAYFVHFREILPQFSSDYNQNWGGCTK